MPRRRPADTTSPEPDPAPAPVEVAQPDPVPTPLDELHPRNYRSHPPDQLVHLKASLVDNGVYRNVVAARGGVLVAGHGVVQAARELGLTTIKVIHLDIDPDHPRALKILAADNTLGHFAMDDDRMLTNLLRDVAEADSLIGTGYDEASLAAHLMVTRPRSEIEDFDEAAEWVGMPDYENAPPKKQIILNFPDDVSRDDFIRDAGIVITLKNKDIWACTWPFKGRVDQRGSIAFVDDASPDLTPTA